MSWLMRRADNTSTESLAHRLRAQRFRFLASLLDTVPRPLRLLDVGGRAQFWEMMGGIPQGVSVTLLNLRPMPEVQGFATLQGDARDMSHFRTDAFDVVFSNSVIEHVGGWNDQVAAAREMQRVGRRYFVQTPNRWFPVEPHFLFPGFQFLPLGLRAQLHARFRLGWMAPASDYDSALPTVGEIRLLTRREMRTLFPDGRIYTERLAGLAKSFVAYGGWTPGATD
jgi:SAM-dependent methyltransferase